MVCRQSDPQCGLLWRQYHCLRFHRCHFAPLPPPLPLSLRAARRLTSSDIMTASPISDLNPVLIAAVSPFLSLFIPLPFYLFFVHVLYFFLFLLQRLTIAERGADNRVSGRGHSPRSSRCIALPCPSPSLSVSVPTPVPGTLSIPLHAFMFNRLRQGLLPRLPHGGHEAERGPRVGVPAFYSPSRVHARVQAEPAA